MYYFPDLVCLRWPRRRKIFSISTMGMTVAASPMAIRYSFSEMGWKEKSWLRNGMKTTAAVIKSETTRVPQSHRFCFLRVKRDWLRERMLNEWKI